MWFIAHHDGVSSGDESWLSGAGRQMYDIYVANSVPTRRKAAVMTHDVSCNDRSGTRDWWVVVHCLRGTWSDCTGYYTSEEMLLCALVGRCIP